MQHSEVSLRIGKSGLSDGMVNEIILQIKKKKKIKIKILKSALDNITKDEFISAVLEKTNSRLVQKIGNVIVVEKYK